MVNHVLVTCNDGVVFLLPPVVATQCQLRRRNKLVSNTAKSTHHHNDWSLLRFLLYYLLEAEYAVNAAY